MRRTTVVTIALISVSTIASAQVHPTLQRGFTPESSFEAGEIDAINLFNGSLTLAFPIGPKYPVGGNLTYGLTLSYSSLLWDFSMEENEPSPPCDDPNFDCPVVLKASPSAASNAGLGWRLSLGELYGDGVWPNTGGDGKWLYIAPDGSRHLLIHTLHENQTHTADFYYSRDNTYLRMEITAFDQYGNASEAVLEEPDGTAHTFEVGYYVNTMSLTKIEDRFGNSISVTYSYDEGEIDEWILTDSLGRVQRIFWTTVADTRVVDRIELSAFGTSIAAVYQFVYDSAPGGSTIEETCKDQFWGGADTTVPLLLEVQLPDGSSYRMTDSVGAPAYYTENVEGTGSSCQVPYSGILKRLTLPTGGIYEWDFGRYEYPTGGGAGGCSETVNELWQVGFGFTAGVVQRRISSAPGQTATWDYYRGAVTDPLVDAVTTTVTSPDTNDTVHYFRTQACRYDETVGGQIAWTGWDYGLPFTPDIDDGNGRFRSIAYYEGSGASRTLLRSQYLLYEHDQLPPLSSALDWYDTNRRVSESSTIHFDEIPLTSKINFSTDFDGLGHYRQSTASGFGAGDRTETTNFNPGGGSYSIGASNNYTGDFVLPSTQDPWVIGLYDLTTQLEDGVTAEQEHCFDSQTGVLEGTRTLKTGSTRSATDLLTVFAYDASGNVASESYYGGDRQGGLSTTSPCSTEATEAEYKVVNTYESGVLKTRKFDGEEFFITDNTFDDQNTGIDHNTGLVSASRDVSKFRTEFDYDSMGRVIEVAPDEGARVAITYTAAIDDVSEPTYAPAEVSVEYRDSLNTLVAAEKFKYDGLGRVISQKRKMPDNSWSERLTEYTGMGWIYRVSEFDSEGTLSPNWTTYSSFDPFGRAHLVTRPDGTTVAFDFDGERVASQTVSIATSTSGETPFATTTYSDHLGRVTEVQEPLSVTSSYDYDVGGRLKQVDVATTGGTQSRYFNYDNRGFLTSETMPEKGASGNGSVTYSFYDTMGNAHKVVDGPSELWLTYDGAGRIIEVEADASCGPLTVKSFSYGQANDGNNLVLGKLQSASMANYFDDLESVCSGASKVLGDHIFSDGFESGNTSAWGFILFGVEALSISQFFEYSGLGGRLSELITLAEGGEFTQTYTWSDLGELKTMKYPDLEGYTEPAAAISTLTYGYTNGFLTSVNGYASNITYHPNGTLDTLTRTNGGTDVFALDPDGMPRTRWLRGKKGGGTLWYSGLYEYDGAGNVTDVGSDTYVYDGLSRLLAGTAEGGAKTQSYTYDGFGNLASITDSQGTRTITVSSTTNRVASPATYDAAGNLTSWGGYTYEWTPTGEMHSRTGTGLNRRFSYTADGERVVSENLLTGTSTFSLRDPSGKVIRVFEKTGSTWSWEKDYVYRNGILLASEDSSGTLFFTLDHLGTPRLVTDSSGDQVRQHAYYGFGEEATTGWADEALKFTGHERDLEGSPDTNDDLDYMHARYYNPLIGRFLSVDPVGGSVGSSQSWNRYAYVLNSPVNFVDPTGEEIALDIEDDEYLHDLLAQWEQESGLDLGLNDGIVMINGVKLNESGQPLGSEKARQILTDRINASDVFTIHGVSDDPNVWMGQAQGGHITLDFGDIAEIEYGLTPSSTFNAGMIGLHELAHTRGFVDPPYGSNAPGDAVGQINIVRDQLGLPGRTQYWPIPDPSSGRMYVPFVSGRVNVPRITFSGAVVVVGR